MSEVEMLTLPDGKVVKSHTVTIADEAMREALKDALVPSATHVVTIHGGVAIRVGQKIVISEREYTVLAKYDPYDNHGIALPEVGSFAHLPAHERAHAEDAALRRRAEVKQSIAAQKGRWLKMLIRKVD